MDSSKTLATICYNDARMVVCVCVEPSTHDIDQLWYCWNLLSCKLPSILQLRYPRSLKFQQPADKLLPSTVKVHRRIDAVCKSPFWSEKGSIVKNNITQLLKFEKFLLNYVKFKSRICHNYPTAMSEVKRGIGTWSLAFETQMAKPPRSTHPGDVDLQQQRLPWVSRYVWNQFGERTIFRSSKHTNKTYNKTGFEMILQLRFRKPGNILV